MNPATKLLGGAGGTCLAFAKNDRLPGRFLSFCRAPIVQSGVASPEGRARLDALGSLYREPLGVFYRGAKEAREKN